MPRTVIRGRIILLVMAAGCAILLGGFAYHALAAFSDGKIAGSVMHDYLLPGDDDAILESEGGGLLPDITGGVLAETADSDVVVTLDLPSTRAGIAAVAAARQAADAWNDANPGTVNFMVVALSDASDGDVVIRLAEKTAGDSIGLYEHARWGTPAIITVETGRPWCDGMFREYSQDMLANIITHELGHHLGLGHISDKTHLMYGTDPHRAHPGSFDDLGYAMPQYEQYPQFAALVPLLAEMEEAESEIATLDASISRTLERMERLRLEHAALADRYESLELQYSSAYDPEDWIQYGRAQLLHSQAERLLDRIRETEDIIGLVVDEHDGLRQEYDDAVDRYNAAANRYNCAAD